MILDDVHARPDLRGIAITSAGITGLSYPSTIVELCGTTYDTVAEYEVGVSLDAHDKGVHMSRLVELVHVTAPSIRLDQLEGLVDATTERLHAERASWSITFPFFVDRRAPVTRAVGKLSCTGHLLISGSPGEVTAVVAVTVPITTLCPCSKAISDYGAHNQRSLLRIEATLAPGQVVGLTELAELGLCAGSAPVFPVLKRPDERFVTMYAYEHPKFAEDVVRDVALQLRHDRRLVKACLRVDNLESIHGHDAYAIVTVP